MNPLISKKVEELIALAESENEPALQSILYTYQGAKMAGMEVNLCKKVNEYTKDVLIPHIQSLQELSKVSKN